VLSRTIAMRNHYPAIDVLASISRLMNDIVDEQHKELSRKLRRILSVYNENYDLISIGAYKAGTNSELDYAVDNIEKINLFLNQGIDESFSYEQTIEFMKNAVN
jgi:flagellum-specific ATP synthase